MGVAPVLCGVLATLAIEDPQLEDVRDEVSESDDEDDDDDDDDSDGEGDGGALIEAVGGLIEIGDGRYALPPFASHPYAGGRRAGLTTSTDHTATGASPGFVGRVALDGAWQYHGLWRGRFAFEFDTTTRLGAGLQMYAWGNPGTADHMLLASVRGHGLIGNWRRVMLRIGPGLDVLRSWTPHRLLVALGVDWGLAAEIFPVRPLVLSFDGKVGIVGRSLYLAGRATVGVIVNRVEFFGGYEHQQFGAAGVGGPILGLRVWF